MITKGRYFKKVKITKDGWIYTSINVKYNALATRLAIAGILLKKVLAIK